MNAIPTKMCVDCLIVLAVTDFPAREANGRAYRASTCVCCTRRRWRAARIRCDARKGIVRNRTGARGQATKLDAPKSYTPKPCPYALPSVGVQRHAPVRWNVGVRL